MSDKLFIKNVRQKRAIQILTGKKSVKVKDIGPIIGALNPRQIIMELRRQRFWEIIIARWFIIYDELKPIARKALKECIALEPKIRKANSDIDKSNDSKEGNNESIL